MSLSPMSLLVPMTLVGFTALSELVNSTLPTRAAGGGDDVGDAEHIGFDGLCGRKLAGGNMLEGRRVNNGIHACEQRFQPTFVTHIAKDKGERPE